LISRASMCSVAEYRPCDGAEDLRSIRRVLDSFALLLLAVR
jgi:hypothetical protein